MGIATKPWNDENRFNQTGYSASTLFPEKENYTNFDLYLEDLEKAEYRENNHQEFLDELREEAREESYRESLELEEGEI